MNLTSFDAALKDRYPRPGERLKQYVVDERNETAWERETCPRVQMPLHDDNTGVQCWNVAAIPWRDLDHSQCQTCGEAYAATQKHPDVVAWLAEKAKRPPICAGRDKLSDEIAPEIDLRDNPVLAMLKKRAP